MPKGRQSAEKISVLATGKVEFGSGVSLNWVGATYIDKDGVFTGTLSADTIKTISISACACGSGGPPGLSAPGDCRV